MYLGEGKLLLVCLGVPLSVLYLIKLDLQIVDLSLNLKEFFGVIVAQLRVLCHREHDAALGLAVRMVALLVLLGRNSSIFLVGNAVPTQILGLDALWTWVRSLLHMR